MNIYVGNLSFNVTDDELKKLFGAFGKVTDVNVIKDKYTGNSQGFGFVEMEKRSEVEHAVKRLHGHVLAGRAITVNVARRRNGRSQSEQS